MDPVWVLSYEPIIQQAIDQLNQRNNTALLSAPGCGASTLLSRIILELDKMGNHITYLDMRSKREFSSKIAEINEIKTTAEDNHILVVDHSMDLSDDNFRALADIIKKKASQPGITCLWVGNLDLKQISSKFGIELCNTPRSRISFPILPRDELISIYQAIAINNGCNWGEAIIYLLLDYCGSDLSLLCSLTNYIFGDWTDKIYDASIWERLSNWFSHEPKVDYYRSSINKLDQECINYLRLILIGGKPACEMKEWFEEANDPLRQLCLNGFLIQNLLPNYYQARNLTIKCLLNEMIDGGNGFSFELIYRNLTNQRVGRLIYDFESMLRLMMHNLIRNMPSKEIINLLEDRQCEDEFIPGDFNKALLTWSHENVDEAKHRIFVDLIKEHRSKFKKTNSLWNKLNILMDKDRAELESVSIPRHILCVDYLTYNEMASLIMTLFDKIFVQAQSKPEEYKLIRERWSVNLSKIGRLRNNVAHLRNIKFQDVQDLLGALDSMRSDIIKYTDWKRENGS